MYVNDYRFFTVANNSWRYIAFNSVNKYELYHSYRI